MRAVGDQAGHPSTMNNEQTRKEHLIFVACKVFHPRSLEEIYGRCSSGKRARRGATRVEWVRRVRAQESNRAPLREKRAASLEGAIYVRREQYGIDPDSLRLLSISTYRA